MDNVLGNISRRAVAVVGDLNVDLLNEDDSTDMCNVMFSHSFFPLVNIATRVTENTATCLDHIWYNRSNIIASGAFIADISDHYPIFTALNIYKIIDQ